MQNRTKTSDSFLSNIDVVRYVDSFLHLRGWVFHPQDLIESVEIRINGLVIAKDLKLTERPDVQQHYLNNTAISPPLCSGFDVRAEWVGRPEILHDALVTIIPSRPRGGMEVVHSIYCDVAHEETNRPQPPVHLKERIGGSASYVQIGTSALGLILSAIGAARAPSQLGRILDWGAGSGRIARQLAKFVPPNTVFACDIDPEAIEWAQLNIPGVSFATVPPIPPTQYEASFFDTVYGISVMTHLDEPTQIKWLEELRRITRPGALLVLSVISEPLRRLRMPAHLEREFNSKGFVTFVPDYEKEHGFRDFSDAGYYKESFHTIDYINRVWGEYFSVDKHVKTRGHDLIVLRRPAD